MSKALRYANLDALPKGLQDAARKAMAALPQPQDPKKQKLASANEPNISKNKYGAVPTMVDGIRFDSKREARYYMRLKGQQAEGFVRYFLRQVPLHLPGGTRLVVDFVEFHADGSVHYVDVKGRETDAFKIKRREIQAVYPITIELV